MAASAYMLEGAWGDALAEERRFKRILSAALVAFIALSIALPYLHVVSRERAAFVPVPARYAKLITERKDTPPPKPERHELSPAQQEALRQAQEARKLRLEEEQRQREEERHQLALQAKPVTPPSRPVDVERERTDIESQRAELEQQRALVERARLEEVARQQAEAERQRVEAEKRKGAALARNVFGDLAPVTAAPVAGAIGRAGTPLVSGKGGGTQPKVGDALTSRMGSAAGKGSGGIGGTGLAGLDPGLTARGELGKRQTTQVDDAKIAGVAKEDVGKVVAPGKIGRPRAEYSLIFEKNKATLYQQYQRLLRKDPTASGKVVVELTILPSGKVAECRVVSSEIRDDEFLTKLVTRIKGLDFGAKEVEPITITYPIDFVPDA